MNDITDHDALPVFIQPETFLAEAVSLRIAMPGKPTLVDEPTVVLVLDGNMIASGMATKAQVILSLNDPASAIEVSMAIHKAAVEGMNCDPDDLGQVNLSVSSKDTEEEGT